MLTCYKGVCWLKPILTTSFCLVWIQREDEKLSMMPHVSFWIPLCYIHVHASTCLCIQMSYWCTYIKCIYHTYALYELHGRNGAQNETDYTVIIKRKEVFSLQKLKYFLTVPSCTCISCWFIACFTTKFENKSARNYLSFSLCRKYHLHTRFFWTYSEESCDDIMQLHCVCICSSWFSWYTSFR